MTTNLDINTYNMHYDMDKNFKDLSKYKKTEYVKRLQYFTNELRVNKITDYYESLKYVLINLYIFDKFIGKCDYTKSTIVSIIYNIYMNIPKEHMSYIKKYVDINVKYSNHIFRENKCFDNEYTIYTYIDDICIRDEILHYFYICSLSGPRKTHILSDIDDTISISNIGGTDISHINKCMLPYVDEFHKFASDTHYSTLLSARPQILENKTRNDFKKKYNDGIFVQSNVLSGTIYNLKNIGLLKAWLSNRLSTLDHYNRAHTLEKLFETKWYRCFFDLGKTKYDQYINYGNIYPEYDFIFIGDTGQGDLITALLMRNLIPGYNNINNNIKAIYIRDIVRSKHFFPRKIDDLIDGLLPDDFVNFLIENDIYIFKTYAELIVKTKDFIGINLDDIFRTEPFENKISNIPIKDKLIEHYKYYINSSNDNINR